MSCALLLVACVTPVQPPDYSDLPTVADVDRQCRAFAESEAASGKETVRRTIELGAGNPYVYPVEKYYEACMKNSGRRDQ